MNTVFSNDMCAHVWAQQSQPHGRSDNMSFEGRTLYSYRTAIGYIPDGARFGLCALLTSRTYSMTTSSRHMPAAHSAVRGRETFSVPHLSDSPEALAANLEYLVKACRDNVESCMRFQSWHWTSVTDVQESFAASWQHVTAFATRFGLTAPADTIVADAARVWARCERLTAKRADPKHAARLEAQRAKAAARRDAKQQAAFEERERRRAAWETERAERERVERMSQAERLQRWLTGEFVPGFHYTDENGSALLRVDWGNDRVQTSLGAEVSLEHVRHALRLYQRVRASGLAWVRAEYPTDATALESDTLRRETTLGHFRLDAIDLDGNVRAGCHTISAAVIAEFAARIEPVRHSWDANGAPV